MAPIAFEDAIEEFALAAAARGEFVTVELSQFTVCGCSGIRQREMIRLIQVVFVDIWCTGGSILG
jgi:hypothetical protein